MYYQYHEMLQKLQRRHLDDKREELSLTAKNENMDVFVNNLAELNNI